MPSKLSLKLETPIEAEFQILDRDPLISALGAFGFAEIHRAELTGIAAKLLHREDLTTAEIRHLIASVPLAQLAKLARLSTPAPAKVCVRPVALIAVAGAIEEGGKKFAVQVAQAALRRIAEAVRLAETVYIALDRWNGQFELSDLLAVLGEVKAAWPNNLEYLGPSSFEIRELLRGRHLEAPAHMSLRELLALMKTAGVCSVEGGTDFEIHLGAARAGIAAAVGQAVAEEPTADPAEQMPLLGMAASDRYSFSSFIKTERFLSDLLFVKSQLAPTGALQTWFPWHPTPLSACPARHRGGLTLHIMRSIALARIFLPEVPFIRAPLAVIGPDLLELALLCGANDLGYAAVDSSTAELLGVAKLSRLEGLVQSGVIYRNVIESSAAGRRPDASRFV